MNPERIQPGPMYSGSTPARDPLYRRFIKTFPCVACARNWWVECCHTGPHALSQKSSDYDCIPLCRKCHPEFDSNPALFAQKHDLKIPALIQQFRSFYDKKEKKAA